MSEEVLKDIRELLNEEKWTRAVIANYSVTHLEELDELIDKVGAAEAFEEVEQECNEYLEHNKNSVNALYLSGILSLRRQHLDDARMTTLVRIFSENHRWSVVAFLSKKMLQYRESRFALRTLAESYENEKEEAKKYEIWERLIRVDYEEADIVKKIAEKKDREGSTEEAAAYYKKAIHRYINRSSFSQVKEVWNKLLGIKKDDREFFSLIENKVFRMMGAAKVVQLLEEEYPLFVEDQNWDVAIGILKRVLTHDVKNGWARREIVQCFREKYKEHTHLEEYLKFSNLSQNWRNALEAVADFEKHIFFDSGTFVFHNSWGLGVIKEIKENQVRIDFSRNRGHRMSLKMAVNALQSLPKDHIWVIKGIMKREQLHQLVKKDIPWALKTIIKSFNNMADLKTIKAELVPSIMTPGEWTSWSSEAKRILRTDTSFGNLPDKQDRYVVRDKPISYEEKTFNQFKSEKSFFEKIRTTRDFLAHSDPDSDYFEDMFQFFVSFLKTTNVTEYVIASFLFLEKVTEIYPFLDTGVDLTFKELYEGIENVNILYKNLDDPELREEFLKQTREHFEDWANIYVGLFLESPSQKVIEDLVGGGDLSIVRRMVTGVVEAYKERRETFVWFARNIIDEPWFDKLGVHHEKILLNMLHLLDLTYRDIRHKKEAALNRRLNKMILTYLFKEKRLEEFILNGTKETAARYLPFLQEVKDLNPSIELALRKKVKEKFPKLALFAEQAQKVKLTPSQATLLTTEASYARKQRELRNILEIEIPKNSKEIGAAMELGDLRENAEYKAGKERQENLNIQVGRLRDEIGRAKVYELEKVDLTEISFGTAFVLRNLETKGTENFTILGPWESDPSKNIISYLSPFGNGLLGHKVGDQIRFDLNGREFAYEVLSIGACRSPDDAPSVTEEGEEKKGRSSRQHLTMAKEPQ